MKSVLQFDSIGSFHRYLNLPKAEHPLISLIDYSRIDYPDDSSEIRWVQGFYSIGLKRNVREKFNYGHQPYDFDEGILSLVAPQQVLRIEINSQVQTEPSGWLLLIHPDFLWGTSLATTIKKYDFFGYAVNEALFLSEKEENSIVDIFKNIQREYQSNVDKFSQKIAVSQIELLLNYTERFYERQFITRKITNHQVLNHLEEVLADYLNDDHLSQYGPPSVQKVADHLNLSPNYLSSLLKTLTGRSTQQHIRHQLVEKAKTKLSTTELSVSEIAYELGFEHPASFSKLFKNKVNISPIEFRQKYAPE
ncbi:MAG: helix-turn-helix transcriptional regulator [Bacteroidota bacterium]